MRPLLRDGPRSALGPDGARAPRDRRRRGQARRRSRRRDPRELRRRRHRRVRRAGRPRRPPAPRPAARHGDLLQLPAGPRPPAEPEAPRGGRRSDDDDALPIRSRLSRRIRRAGRPRDDGRDPRRPRHPPAPRRRDGEVRARHVLLQRRPRGRVAGRDANPRAEPARRAELRPQAGDVGRRGRRPSGRGARRRLRVLRDQLRQPRHGRAHRLDPGGDHRGRDGRPVPRSSDGPCLRVGRRLPRHGRPRQRGADVRS